MFPTLTAKEREFFSALANDSWNWGGTPLFGGNVDDSAENKGLLTTLKTKGLLTSFRSEGSTWIEPTDQGRAYAEAITMPWYN